MTLMSFGRAVPIHMDMLVLVGYELSQRDIRPAATQDVRKRAMMAGLHSLRRITKNDFGYDAVAWRKFLIESGDKFGYTHAYAFASVDRAVRTALEDPNVIATLKLLAET